MVEDVEKQMNEDMPWYVWDKHPTGEGDEILAMPGTPTVTVQVSGNYAKVKADLETAFADLTDRSREKLERAFESYTMSRLPSRSEWQRDPSLWRLVENITWFPVEPYWVGGPTCGVVVRVEDADHVATGLKVFLAKPGSRKVEWYVPKFVETDGRREREYLAQRFPDLIKDPLSVLTVGGWTTKGMSP